MAEKRTLIIIGSGNKEIIERLLKVIGTDIGIVTVSKDHIYPMCLVDVKDIEKSILPGKLELIDKINYHNPKSYQVIGRMKRKLKKKK